MEKVIGLVVTTEHKGVFFGYGTPTTEKVIRLEKARMAVYWDSNAKSVVGLASQGPGPGCRVGPPAPAITLQEVTSVMECSDEAVQAWEKGPWQ